MFVDIVPENLFQSVADNRNMLRTATNVTGDRAVAVVAGSEGQLREPDLSEETGWTRIGAREEEYADRQRDRAR